MQLPDNSTLARPHLRRLVARVQAEPAEPPACGRYAYLHLRRWSTSGDVASDGQSTSQPVEVTYQRWRADNGSGRVITSRHEPDAAPEKTTENFRAGELPGALSAPVNTDPGLLSSQMDHIHPVARGDQSYIRATADIYGWHTPTRDQRAAILTVLLNTELTWRGTAADRVGRPGVAVSFDSDNGHVRDLLILDPTSGRPLAYEQVILRNPGRMTGPFPAVQDYVLFLNHSRRNDVS